MLQFKLYPSTSAVIIYCEDVENFIFPLNTPQICGGGMGGVKNLTEIRFSADHRHLLYIVGGIKYNTQSLPGLSHCTVV